MRTGLRVVALLITLTATALWFFSGPNFGWTKTSVLVRRVEPVTGLEEKIVEKRFLPGVDYLVAGLLAGGILGGISFLFRNKEHPPAPPTRPTPPSQADSAGGPKQR